MSASRGGARVDATARSLEAPRQTIFRSSALRGKGRICVRCTPERRGFLGGFIGYAFRLKEVRSEKAVSRRRSFDRKEEGSAEAGWSDPRPIGTGLRAAETSTEEGC
jgi:hypothetical protein